MSGSPEPSRPRAACSVGSPRSTPGRVNTSTFEASPAPRLDEILAGLADTRPTLRAEKPGAALPLDGLRAWFAGLDRDAAVAARVRAGVPAAPLTNAHFIVPNPQLEHRRFFQTLEHPVTGPTRYPGLPMPFSALGRELQRRPPPTLGQHNEDILAGELGLTSDEIADLRERRIIGDRPTLM